MTTEQRDVPWIGREFLENRAKAPPELLAPYAGQYVAWSADGKQIVLSDEDEGGLYRKLNAAGIDTSRVVIDYIPRPGEVVF
jgi:hypothetical protein